MKKFSLGKSKRVRGRSRFRQILAQRRRMGRGFLCAYVGANGLKHSRMAVSVRKNWGGAVARNRVKRLVREAFRTRQFDFPAGYDYIFIINRGFNTRRSKDRKVDILPQSVTLSEIMARFDVILKQIKEQADLI